MESYKIAIDLVCLMMIQNLSFSADRQHKMLECQRFIAGEEESELTHQNQTSSKSVQFCAIPQRLCSFS